MDIPHFYLSFNLLVNILLFFHILAILNNAAMGIHVQVFVWTYIFSSFGYTPRSGIAKSYYNSMFNILRDCQTVFQSDCMIFTFLPAILEGFNCSISSPLFRLQPSWWVWNGIFLWLIHISLMANDVEHQFMCFWPFVYLIWRNICSNLLPIFNGVICFVFCHCRVVRVFMQSGYKFLIGYMICKYFLPFHWLSFYFLDSVLEVQEFLILMKSNFSIFVFGHLVSYQRRPCLNQGHEVLFF